MTLLQVLLDIFKQLNLVFEIYFHKQTQLQFILILYYVTRPQMEMEMTGIQVLQIYAIHTELQCGTFSRFSVPVYTFLYDRPRAGPAGTGWARLYARCCQTAPQRGSNTKPPHVCQHFLLQSNLSHGANQMNVTLHLIYCLSDFFTMLLFIALCSFLHQFFSSLQLTFTYFDINHLFQLCCNLWFLFQPMYNISTINYTINVVQFTNICLMVCHSCFIATASES